MEKSKIEWCDSTWNPVTGCYHDCEYCYARTMVNRFGAKTDPDFAEKIIVLDNPVFKDKKSDALPKINPKREPYPYGFIPTLHKYRLHDCKYKRQEGRNIFVCSMADLFGDWVPDGWINEVMKACANAPKHNYLFLTKNPERYINLSDNSNNLWYGATVTDEESLVTAGICFMEQRVNAERYFNTFLSIEPIQSEINIKKCDGYFSCLDWIIIGAETGNRKDKVVPEREWISSIVEQCDQCGIPVFMKDSLVPIIGEENMRREFPKELKK